VAVKSFQNERGPECVEQQQSIVWIRDVF
jgi:hypothetical protein